MRIGHKMRAAKAFVARYPGCSILAVAKYIGPSNRFGYASVHRAIRAGLIEAPRLVCRYALRVKAGR